MQTLTVDANPLSDQPGLEHWLASLRRYWWVIVVCVTLLAGSAAAFSLTRRKQYTATASLYFTQSQIGADLLGITVNSANATPQTIQADDVKLVQSPEVALLVSRALGGRLTPTQVTQNISVSGQGQSDFVAVQAESANPVFAATLANLYARQFITFRARSERAAVLQVRASLARQLQAMTPAEQRSSAGASLRARIEQLSTLAAAQTGDAQLVQPAAIPRSPSYPKTKLNIGIAAALGLLLGVGLMVLLERFNRKVHDVEELGHLYQLPILAQVPEDAALVADGENPNGPGAASFEMLRARLRYFNIDRRLKVLLVTSCLPEEGKTTVAWHLAWAAAVVGARVLLLEVDFRKPAIARQHGLAGCPGLAELLAGDSELTEARQEVTIAVGEGRRRFDVLVAGAVPPNPAELVESLRMRQLLRALREEYELIVIDSGPALVVPDPLALMSEVDGVVIVGRVDGSTREDAAQLREALESVGAPTVGIVANRVKGRAGGGYYGYYGYSLFNGRVQPSGGSARAARAREGGAIAPEPPSAGTSA
jgi:succinoglycan biosynthesis transport protein ExoP